MELFILHTPLLGSAGSAVTSTALQVMSGLFIVLFLTLTPLTGGHNPHQPNPFSFVRSSPLFVYWSNRLLSSVNFGSLHAFFLEFGPPF